MKETNSHAADSNSPAAPAREDRLLPRRTRRPLVPARAELQVTSLPPAGGVAWTSGLLPGAARARMQPAPGGGPRATLQSSGGGAKGTTGAHGAPSATATGVFNTSDMGKRTVAGAVADSGRRAGEVCQAADGWR